MADCGHWCCQIRDNAYHGHLSSPGRCERCAVALAEEGGEILDCMLAEVDAIVASVAGRVVPGIPGLPNGDELQELIEAKAREVYLDGLADPDLVGLDRGTVRQVLAVRVGLGLAFPAG